ncbi:AAA family ATPase [Gammaproteobacteria bacterium]|nr:AAA family ATPase [Gammaproteobacteria bacterium]
MNSKIFAIINQKGGVGKTTTAVSVAAANAKMGKRVLLIDLDPQTNASTACLANWEQSIGEVLSQQCTLKDAIYHSEEEFDVLPAQYNLTAAEHALLKAPQKEHILTNLLAPVMDQYDLVFIDCSPSLNILSINALVSAKNLIIPIQCEYYALEGLSKLLQTIRAVSQSIGISHQLYLLRTMYDGRNRLAVDVSAELKAHFNDALLNTVIPRNTRLAEAPSFGQSIFNYDNTSQGAIAYLALASELNRLMKQQETVNG